jgi:DNA-binding NarL/FixJ family response regulator
MGDRTRVVLADDQALIRTAIRSLLDSAGDLDVVAEAADGVEAVAAARRHRPHVVVMDVRMPRLNGIEAARRLQEEVPGTAAIALTTFDVDEYVFEAVRAGAVGFFLKDGDAGALLEGIRAARRGEAVMDPSALRRLMREFAGRPAPSAAERRLLDTLSPREREVLSVMAEGLTNEEIAERLVISQATVKTHVGAILAKLDARDRTQAVVRAWRAGITA